MKYKIGDLVLREEDVDLYLVHRDMDKPYHGFIGVICVKTGIRLQISYAWLTKIETEVV
tara:strand:- start:1790 stop:1966 length:177 start_codon:yes stop_codon:yes gene_type:complete